MRTRVAVVSLVGTLLVSVAAGCSDDPAPPDGTGGTPTGGAASRPVADAGADATSDATVFNDDGASGTVSCDGEDVSVNGEGADLHLTGDCGTVVVNGAGARVQVDQARLIVINGDEATVTYGGDPEVVLNGAGASAERA